jgi:hypothetical protein
MSSTLLDEPLLRHTDTAWARPLPDAIRDARSDLPAIVADILAIPEAALERVWAWTGNGEVEARYGMYRAYELFERAEIEAARALREAGIDGGLAAAIGGPGTAARWDLHGVLAPLSDADIDADPGGGEWTIRRTLGHTISSQRSYGWGTAWWQDQGLAVDDPNLPDGAGDEFWASLPDDETAECAGTLGDIRGRLDAILDLADERLAGLPEARLGNAARWSGYAVPASHRIGRWSSHIREHTIQVEKTLAMLGRTPTEPERLVRLVLAAYGRAEATVFGQPGAEVIAATIRARVGEVRGMVADARRAAEA